MTHVRYATDQEVADWNRLIEQNPDGGEIFQTHAMAEVKKLQGWKPEFWVYETSFGLLYVMALTRSVFGLGRLAYIMRGPGVVTRAQLDEVVTLTKDWQQSAFAIKFEPPILQSEAGEGVPTSMVATRAIQPNVHTIYVDLDRSEEDILASFRQRARREIRAAVKDGITVKQVELTDETIDQMYGLYHETAQRAGFFLRPKSYIETFWRTFNGEGLGELYFAYAPDDQQPVAGAFVCANGTRAVYKDGGSRRTNAKHFAHLLQWEIMRSLRQRGVKSYDLHGVPPSDKLEDPNHPLAGLAMFKLSFAQEPTDYIGAFDYVGDAKKYAIWARYWERLHHAYAHRVRKTTFY